MASTHRQRRHGLMEWVGYGVAGLTMLVILTAVSSGLRQQPWVAKQATPTTSFDAPMTVTGSGTSNSSPVHLSGGNYVIAWTHTGATGGFSFSARLTLTTCSTWVGCAEKQTIADIDDRPSGTTNVYQVKPGDYYVEADTKGDWTVRITQQP